MGVIGLAAWIASTYKEHSVEVKAEAGGHAYQFDHIHFDMNTLVHNAVSTSTNAEEISQHVTSAMTRMLSKCQPKTSITLCYDGPTPHAKILQQRQRRIRQPDLEQMITPGSQMLVDVEYHVTQRLGQYLKRKNWDGLIVVSGSSVPEEGEIKIAQRIGQISKQYGMDDSHLIVGCDSDLFLICAATSSAHNLSVLHPFTDRLVCVTSIFLQWMKAVGVPISSSEYVSVLRGLRFDFVVLWMMNGCDYFGGVQGYSAPAAWNAYLTQRASSKSKSTKGCDFVRLSSNDMHVALRRKSLAEFFSANFSRAYQDVASNSESFLTTCAEIEPSVLEYLKGMAWVVQTLV
eukprot:PhF_6_TR18948/c0_g1_i2/m.27778